LLTRLTMQGGNAVSRRAIVIDCCVADCEGPRVGAANTLTPSVSIVSNTHVALRDSDGSSAELVVLLSLEDCQRSPTWSSRERREIVSYCITPLVSSFRSHPVQVHEWDY
jgi:hypothetical protein